MRVSDIVNILDSYSVDYINEGNLVRANAFNKIAEEILDLVKKENTELKEKCSKMEKVCISEAMRRNKVQ